MAGRESSFDGHQSRNEPQGGRPRSIFDGQACQKKGLRIGDMNAESFDKACLLLNAPLPGKNWKALGGKLDYTVNEMVMFEMEKNKAGTMLLHWGTERNHNVENLITKLREIGIDQVANIFQDEIDEKGKNCNCPDCGSILW